MRDVHYSPTPPPTQAARAFGSKSNGPVNLESRILRNPILAKDEPPFEVPWLLKHGKVCVYMCVRAFQGTHFLSPQHSMAQPKRMGSL